VLGPTIGDLLPSAVAVAISPVPIVAVILMLATPRARSNGAAFALGWLAGLTGVTALVVLVAGDTDSNDDASTGASAVVLLLGLLFLFLAVKQWRSRPAAGETPPAPSWMAAIDRFTTGRSLAMGVVLSAANPKNLALSVAAAATVAQAGLPAGEDVVAIAAFVIVGSLTVVGPVAAYLVGGERTQRPLASAKQFMTTYSWVIMLILFVVLGAKLIGQGVAGLTD
jgi:threonine/homoserine/homoserine lactone efflux protein